MAGADAQIAIVPVMASADRPSKRAAAIQASIRNGADDQPE